MSVTAIKEAIIKDKKKWRKLLKQMREEFYTPETSIKFNNKLDESNLE